MTEPNHNLPRRRKRFIGRDRELALIDEYLEAFPLVTVVAGGGMGKTRLSMQFGANAAQFERVVFCDLTEARDERSCASRVTREVFGADQKTEDPREAAHMLADVSDTLVILDNLEQVVAPAANVVRLWMEHAPHVRFLATSREPLHLRGERRLPLDPLGVDRAIELFEHRARQVRHGFKVDESNRPTVARIIRRLDGLPLAVELAAARINVFSPADILERLESKKGGLETLVRKTRHATVRHQTMRGTLEWSWELLNDPERAVLSGASVFSGGFDLRAAEDVLSSEFSSSDSVWVGDILEALSDKSLINTRQASGSADRRFQLFETTARFAASKLDAERRRELERLHAWHYVQRLEEHRGPPLIHEKRNIVDAFWSSVDRDAGLAARAAVCATRQLRLEGSVEDRLRIINAALEQNFQDAKLRAKLLAARTTCYLSRGEFTAALHDIEPGLDAADQAETQSTRAFLLYSRAEAYRGRGQPAQAKQPLRDALEIAESRSDRRGEATIRTALGDVDFALGNLEAATREWHDALEVAHRKKFRDLRGRILVQMGRHDMLHGDFSAAQRRLEDARKSVENPSPSLQRMRAEGLAELEWLRGDDEAARDHLTRALELGSATDHYDDSIDAHFGLAVLNQETDPDAADTHLDAVRELVWDNDDVFNRVQVHIRLGIIRLGQKDLREATHLFERGVDEASRLDDCRVRAHARAWLAMSTAADGRADDARSLIHESETELREHQFDELAEQMSAFRTCADHLSGNGQETQDLLEALRDATARERPNAARRIATWRFYDPRSELTRIVETVRSPEVKEEGLVIARDGSTFELPNGERVDLSSRQALRLILSELGTLRQANPGGGITVDELRHVGWPDEKLTEDAGSSRVYTAIRNLRSIGLDEILLTGHDGYYLDPEIPFRWGS